MADSLVLFAAGVQSATGNEVRRLMKSLGGHAYVNEKHGTIQIRGCDGQVIATIPLTKALLKAFWAD